MDYIANWVAHNQFIIGTTILAGFIAVIYAISGRVVEWFSRKGGEW